jgi:hypothetical protein
MENENSDFQGDRSLSPGSSRQSIEILNVSQSGSGISLASSTPTYQTQSQKIGTEVDSGSGLIQASSALAFQTKSQIRAEVETQSQRAVEEFKSKNNQTIPNPVPIADFVLKFYRYARVWSTRLQSKVLLRQYKHLRTNVFIFYFSNFCLCRFLEEETYPSVLKWTRKGTSFVICDLSFFTENVLPVVFRHSNYQSFVRQINKYGFQKIRCAETADHYGRHV